MFLSVRYFDKVPKGTHFIFRDVERIEIQVDTMEEIDGDLIPLLRVSFYDGEGMHIVNRVLDLEVM